MGFFSTSYASDVSSPNSTGIVEILGFPIKLELGISDIIGPSVATIGLIVSAVIFYVGYRRTRRFEQLKLWGESWRKVDEIYYELKEYNTSNFDEKALSSLDRMEPKKTLMRPYFDLIDNLYEEVEFLVTLLKEKDISRNLTESSIKGLDGVINDMININYQIRDDPNKEQVWREYERTINENVAPPGIKPDRRLQDLKGKWRKIMLKKVSRIELKEFIDRASSNSNSSNKKE
jgi:hypothetical protein